MRHFPDPMECFSEEGENGWRQQVLSDHMRTLDMEIDSLSRSVQRAEQRSKPLSEISEVTQLELIPGNPNTRLHDCIEELIYKDGLITCQLCGARLVPCERTI